MAEIIIMPKLGFNMREGRLVQWYKKEGEAVAKGEPLFAIETDKTNIDIEATSDGVVLREFIEEGDVLEVTLPIAIVGAADEDITALLAEAEAKLGRTPAETKPEAAAAAAPAQAKAPAKGARLENGRVKISPRARRVAKENGLDPEALDIEGTGWDGGICEEDVRRYLADNKVKASPVAKAMAAAEGVDLKGLKGTGANGRIMKADVEGVLAAKAPAPAFPAAQGEKAAADGYKLSPDGKKILEEVPYEGVRRVIGERMSESKFTAPHLYFTQRVDLEKLLELRKEVNAAQDKKTSVTDYIARATVMALEKFPQMNASLIGDRIVKYKSVNLGIAVAAPTGLIVPNIKDAQDLSLVELSKAATPLFEKARAGKLVPDEYSGGTFTISNLGMYGIENFTAIINPPEVGILAISATRDEYVVVTDENGNKVPAIRPMMNIQVSVDHRVIDGLLAAQFVTQIKEYLEHPITLMV